jgi:signal transduction histidine kinase
VRGISSQPNDPDRPGPRRLLGRRFRDGGLDLAWLSLVLLNLAAIGFWPSRDTIPFHLISICFALLYWFRVWRADPMLWGIGIVLITTMTGIALDVLRDAGSLEEVTDAPLLATMFVAVVWHANRRITADAERQLIGEKNARLLAAQRRFLQDASHYLRTPVTIALTHAELLTKELTGQQEHRDIQVVVGEIMRLRRLSERLLIITASEDPDFLRSEPVLLDELAMEALERWEQTARRHWKLGRLDAAAVMADPERLGLALDALLENAVKFTTPDDVIELSVVSDGSGEARLRVSDAGTGIPAGDLPHVFDRFRTASNAHGSRGTGLGLALVRAVANAHGGSATVRSAPGEGSEFEILLPGEPHRIRQPASGEPSSLPASGTQPCRAAPRAT